ncbi:MAG: exodeoxyribonuclease VII small subunit [Paraglaciecola sp.]|jgi:exodeoxyribonuclease VII small subunit
MKKTTYESALAEVQSIVNELQEETVSMDDLSKKVGRAAELIQFCRDKLRATETQVNSVFE